MQMRQLVIATFVAGFAFGAVSAPAMAQSPTDVSHASAKNHPVKKRMVQPLPASGQIACTKLGCGRITANCYPTAEFGWHGMPSGYDAIVCR